MDKKYKTLKTIRKQFNWGGGSVRGLGVDTICFGIFFCSHNMSIYKCFNAVELINHVFFCIVCWGWVDLGGLYCYFSTKMPIRKRKLHKS